MKQRAMHKPQKKEMKMMEKKNTLSSSPSLSDGQWEDIKEGEIVDDNEFREETLMDDLEFIESTCSMISPPLTVSGGRHHKCLTPKSNKHYYNHRRHFHSKRSSSSPSFLINHKPGNSLFETNNFEFVLLNTEDECISSSCCKYENDSLVENRDQKALECCKKHSTDKDKSHAPLDVVLERLDYKLKKIEKLEKKSQQEEEIKARYINVKKKFLRMLELGMITAQRDSQNSPPDHSIDILHKAKHNKKAILYLESPEKFSHFLSRKALKYYYKLCQIARYGLQKTEFAATRVLDNLFLGDIDDAFNEPVLNQLGITHIVTCVKSLEPIYPEKGFEYLNLHLYDEEDQNITDIFQLSYEYIEKAIMKGSSVLVHCMKGKSRSASVLISYLMKKNKWTYETTLEFVKSKREFVQPNSGFVSQLKQLERSIFNTDNVTELAPIDSKETPDSKNEKLAICF